MKELDTRQFRGILIMNFLCVGLLCIPRLMISQHSPLPAAFFALALASACACITGKTKIKSGILMFMLFVKLLIEGGMILRIFDEFISAVLLPSADEHLIGGILMLCIAVGITEGIKPSALAARLIMPLVIVIFAVFIIVSAVNTDFSEALSFSAAEPISAAETAYIAAMMFFPLELAFFTRKNHVKNSVISVFVCGILIFAAITVWQARFNYPTAFPVLDLTYNGDLPAAFMRIEEGALVCITTASVYFTLETAACCAAVCTGKPKGYMPVLCIAAIFVLSLIPASLENAKSVLYITALLGDSLFLIIVPLTKLFLAEYRKAAARHMLKRRKSI